MDPQVSAPLTSTLATAGALGLMYIGLAARVIRGRFVYHVSLGDGGKPEMLARIRAHANFSEYVPLVLILMGLIEVSGGSKTVLAWCGAALIVARVLQAIGVELPKAPNPYRFVGTITTFLLVIGFSIWCLRIALG
jgi:uncharacterized membrane protein YecN with MAPEG domain